MHSPNSRRRQRERGSTMVEAAFVTPVFFLLIFGIIEFGFLFRDYLTVSNAASVGARSASVAGNDLDADFFTLRSVNHGLAAINLQDLESIVIFEASGPDDEPPANCIGPTGTSQVSSGSQRGCNVYHAYELSLGLVEDDGLGNEVATTYFGCHPATGSDPASVDISFCPSSRDPRLPDPDFVGVYVAVNHKMITGFFGTNRTLTDTKVIRLEPERAT
ncbi:MAG: pilus assembly protein [Acidimicrobiales bacterium]